MDVRKEVEFFDQFAAEHGDTEVLADAAYRRLLRLFEERVQPKAGELCVDMACGTGAFTRPIRCFGLMLIGVDISSVSIARAARLARGESYLVSDIRRTPFATGSVDIVAYSGVLHHCPTRDARLAVLAEGLRVLRPGGRLFAYDPNAGSPSMWLYRDPRSPLQSKTTKTANEVLIDRRELEDELLLTGFSNVRITGTSGMKFRYVGERLGRLILPLYNLYEDVVRYSPFEDRLGTFLVASAHKGWS